MDDRRLLFFVKNPGQGAVKTLLANAVGEEVAWGLYRNFILDMLSTMQRKSFPLAICFHPEDALADLKKILGENHGYEPQGGDNMGNCLFSWPHFMPTKLVAHSS